MISECTSWSDTVQVYFIVWVTHWLKRGWVVEWGKWPRCIVRAVFTLRSHRQWSEINVRMSNQEMYSTVINVLTMFISLSDWPKCGHCMHMTAWPFSFLVGRKLILQSGLRDDEINVCLCPTKKRIQRSQMSSTDLKRPGQPKCCQELQQKWRWKNARV